MSYDYDKLVQQFTEFRRQAASALSVKDEPNGDAHLSRIEALQGAMDACENLSSHCPMTPLLWIQYGATAFDYCRELANETDAPDKTPSDEMATATKSNSLEMEIQLLQLGLQEFPGSLLLHLRHIYCVERKESLSEKLSQPKGQDLVEALKQAIVHVGRGSYGEEGELIVSRMYNSLALLYAKNGQANQMYDLLVEDQSVRPLPNESLSAFYQSTCKDFNLTPTRKGSTDPEEVMDRSRRLVSKIYYGCLQIQQFEMEIQARLSAQNLLPTWQMMMQSDEEQHFWDLLLNTEKPSIVGMGYGDVVLADQFLKYASALSAYKGFDASNEGESVAACAQKMTRDVHELTLSVFERAVSEAPTVENIWLAYIDLVQDLVRKLKASQGSRTSETTASSPRRLLSISQRACRNCPYSLNLVDRQLQIQYFLAEHSLIVFEPDRLLEKIVEPALASKFLQMDRATSVLYTSILTLIQQRILALLVTGVKKLKSFSESLDLSKTKDLSQSYVESPLPDAVWSEIQDLIEDWLEMSTTMEEGLAKLKTKAAQTTRSLILEHKAIVMEHLVQPLLKAPSFSSRNAAEAGEDEVSKTLQKASRLQNPAHPDTQLSYILHYFLRSSLAKVPLHPSDAAIRLCHVRFLFQHSLQLCGPVDNNLTLLFRRDYHSSLKNLCEEWLSFESRFGSVESKKFATRTIQRKMENFLRATEKVSGQKRFAHEAVEEETAQERATPSDQPSKKLKVNSVGQESSHIEPDEHQEDIDSDDKVGNAAESEVFYVMVGKMKYPAHPFTIRVFNLAGDVEDMDLVDLFQSSKSKCGKIVFARILRDRAGKSKGWGLVQFEERESIEKALQLNETIGLKGKLIKVQRSHVPAVPGLVPAGKQRVNPLGEGKASKRNAKLREHKKADASHHSPVEKDGNGSSIKPPPAPGMLSLVPRGARGRGPKKRL